MKQLLIFLTIIFLSACDVQDQTTAKSDAGLSNDESELSDVQIIGKTIEYVYGEDVYHVTVDSDTQLHWQAVSGSESGDVQHETYVSEYLDDHTIFITWGEANGIGVSQVLDFKKGTVKNHLIRGRDVSAGPGKIRILD